MIAADALALDGIRHGFFTREGGHSTGLFSSLNCGMGSGDNKETVAKNRAVAAERLGVAPDCLLSAWQIHSPDAVVVSAPWDGEERPRADALVTKTAGVGLGVLTADCGPVLFADPKAKVIGAAHAGWKGALAGVTARTLEVMEGQGARRAGIIAVIGPMISRAAYEVGPDFPGRFIEADADNARYFTASPRAGHYMFDLPAYLENRLRAEGVGAVVNLSLCTFSDEQRFFSYRRATHRNEKDYGRLISAIALT
ncbi:MAG: peptidoglycan editing factor PgeF [Aestuariivirga sp.]|uniref:peptidoglycan editing factor PgeF n=1 Tax=Aestuariivirga sp. TaxID=2650926 RepID=UPI0025BAAB5E|nr:peptidoglycan editing factor PgeF [Aestuariivirga sp.]MCA3559968.1 peptidoglycan editing factor PgeF [Aestuariivirga sp.]